MTSVLKAFCSLLSGAELVSTRLEASLGGWENRLRGGWENRDIGGK